MTWHPNDRFYPRISLYLDLGYGPDGEKNLIANQLRKNGFEPDEKTIKATMELTRDIYLFIRENCEAEVAQYRKISKKLKYVGGFVPPNLVIAKELVTFILVVTKPITLGVISSIIGAEIYRRIRKRIEAEKDQAQAEDDIETLEIIEKVYRKVKDMLIEKLPEYLKQIKKEDKDKLAES